MANEEQIELFNALLARGRVRVVVLPKCAGVVLPLGDHTHVILDYDLNFEIPIPDLEVDDRGISATLSFDRSPFKTFVPWESVAAFWLEEERPTTPKRPRLALVD